MHEVDRIEDGDIVAKIYLDESPESPRTWDNLGTMLCFHTRYDLAPTSGKPHML